VTDFRIEYQIQRRTEGDDDFVEIGFGSSGEWHSIDQCAHMLSSAVGNGEWETEPGQPDPDDVLADLPVPGADGKEER
jgi:hypothetical protein